MGLHLLVVGICVIVVVAAIGLALVRRMKAEGGVPRAGMAESMIEAQPPFRRRAYLLTEAEREFFEVLEGIVHEPPLAVAAVGGDGDARGGLREGGERAWARVFVQVPLSALLELPKSTANGQGWRNRIDRKTVDFVLCEAVTLRPLVAIELDDSSHQRADRRKRDAFVEGALETAGLPLVRWRVAQKYRRENVADAVMAAVERGVLG